MTPTHIREIVTYALHLRRDLQRKTIPAFLGDSLVGPLLAKTIADLKALDIPKRLTAERIARDAELGAYEDLQRMWLKGRGQSAPLELAECVQGDFETHPEEGTAAHKVTQRLYGRNGVMLAVIDGGKK